MDNDLISRQAAIDEMAELQGRASSKGELTGISKAWKRIKQLPSVEPERKKGKWNCGDDMFEYALCSACKWDSGEAWEYAKKYFRYCPNCGADMRQDDPSHPFADSVMMKGETDE